MFIRNWENKGGKHTQLVEPPMTVMKNIARIMAWFKPEYDYLMTPEKKQDKIKLLGDLITKFEGMDKEFKFYKPASKYFPIVKEFYNKLINKEEGLNMPKVNTLLSLVEEKDWEYVGDLQDEKYTLIDDSQDVEEINKSYDTDFGCFLAVVGEGDYDELWGIESSVPYNHKKAWRIL